MFPFRKQYCTFQKNTCEILFIGDRGQDRFIEDFSNKTMICYSYLHMNILSQQYESKKGVI